MPAAGYLFVLLYWFNHELTLVFSSILSPCYLVALSMEILFLSSLSVLNYKKIEIVPQLSIFQSLQRSVKFNFEALTMNMGTK